MAKEALPFPHWDLAYHLDLAVWTFYLGVPPKVLRMVRDLLVSDDW